MIYMASQPSFGEFPIHGDGCDSTGMVPAYGNICFPFYSVSFNPL